MSYYRTILARAHALHPGLLEDEALFQALFLVLVAKQKHLVVRTPEEYVSRVLKQVVNILHTLFSLSVVKLKLRQSDKLSPDGFLRLLFLESHFDGHAMSQTSSRKTPIGASSHAFMFKRSSSYPTSAGLVIPEIDEVHDNLQLGVSENGMHSPMRSVMYHERHSLLRAQTDPTPSVLHSEGKRLSGAEPRLLPQAVAVSGLEYTSEQVQSALWTTMSERRISPGHDHQRSGQLSEEMWTLPADFFLVYVCPSGNGCERPPVHRSLVDRFAMIVEVYPSVGNAILDSRLPPPSPKGLDVLPPKSIISLSELADLRLLAGPVHTHISGTLDLYLSDLLSAARHHPHLDGTLLTARCRAEAMHILRAWRVLFGPAQSSRSRVPLSLSVADEDVRRVFVRTVQHRLRVLDGPQQEILASLYFTAPGKSVQDAEWAAGRRSVKDILKEIVDLV
ncbi:hypothetical protein M0805_006392 [Coniferiporia weirii]|nr:hypothetical protein M0805_006392 [Coniferiporia weirii]